MDLETKSLFCSVNKGEKHIYFIPCAGTKDKSYVFEDENQKMERNNFGFSGDPICMNSKKHKTINSLSPYNLLT